MHDTDGQPLTRADLIDLIFSVLWRIATLCLVFALIFIALTL